MPEVAQDTLKQMAAVAAVDEIKDGDVVGLGSGSTLALVIEEIGRRVRAGRLRVTGVATSYQAHSLAVKYGISLRDPMDVEWVDIALDGADEIDAQGTHLKGMGAAQLLEKVVAGMARRYVVVVDETKVVERLGEKRPVVCEVILPALASAQRRLRELGGKPRIREAGGKLGLVISDHGHPIIDAFFDAIPDPHELNNQINNIPGVIGHGLFVGMAEAAIVARSSGSRPRIEKMSFSKGAG